MYTNNHILITKICYIFEVLIISESKHQKFLRLGEKRTEKILEAIRVLGNLSNTKNYYFTEKDIKIIFQEIEKQISFTKSQFNIQLKKQERVKNKFSLTKES